MTILEPARANLLMNKNDTKSTMAQLTACAEDVFRSIPLESKDLVLRLAREQWFFEKNDRAVHNTDQEDGHEGLTDALRVSDVTMIQKSFMRAKQTIEAKESSSSELTDISEAKLGFILPGSDLLIYNYKI